MSTTPLFGVVVPGRAPMFDFQPVNETKAVALLHSPASITEITFFLLPTTPISADFGAILYYSVPPFTNWEVIGAVSLQKPSGIFRTGWSTNEEVSASPVVQLGVALEPMATIENLSLTNSGFEDRFAFAHKIALDLFQYMSSFSTPGPAGSPGGMMVVPSNIFDRWMERFERKYRQDPNFMMKPSI